jgi:beta-lactamase class A
MKEILSKPGIEHKFVAGLASVAPNAQLYRKSGTWAQWHADSAIVEHDGRKYIAVALAEDPAGGLWMRDIIVALDRLILDGSSTRVAAGSARRPQRSGGS